MTAHDLSRVAVELAPPVEVGRAGGHLWFPALLRLDERRILCEATLVEDKPQGEWPATLFLSEDGGSTWRRALDIPCFGHGGTALAPGKLLLQPYELWPLAPGDRRNAVAPGTIVTVNARGELQISRAPVRYLDFPRDLAPYNTDQLLMVVNGTLCPLKNGRLIGTVYGKFAGDARLNLHAMTSEDNGYTWRYMSAIAGPEVAPGAKEGPNEAAIVRLADGRLLCVLRVAMRVPYWTSVSADEGASWSPPAPMTGVGSVKPQLLRLANGVILLSGGRDGIFLWLCEDGLAREWRRLDLVEHHNAHAPEASRYPPGLVGGRENLRPAATTSYTALLALGPEEALVCYDRLANGWQPAPGPYGDESTIFCVRVRARRHGTSR